LNSYNDALPAESDANRPAAFQGGVGDVFHVHWQKDDLPAIMLAILKAFF